MYNQEKVAKENKRQKEMADVIAGDVKQRVKENSLCKDCKVK